MSLLIVENLHVKFGGVHAVNGVNLSIKEGEIYSIVGPNGAGKTTLFNAITGIVKPSAGKIIFEGEDITSKKPHEIATLGIRRTFQNVILFKYMTVLENILLGYHVNFSYGMLNEIIPSKKSNKMNLEAIIKAYNVADLLNLKNRMGVLASLLPYGYQKLVEIARALVSDPKIILLDEPTSGLTETESSWLVSVIRRIRDEMNITVIIIEHNMRIVMDVSDRVMVMNIGKKIAEGKPKEIINDPEVQKVYLGGKL